MVTVTAAQFNRAPSEVKRQVLASEEPVVVTDRAEPSLVVMRYVDYVRLSPQPVIDLADWLRMDEVPEFEVPRLGLELREVDW